MSTRSPQTRLERLLASLDVGPWGALYRAAIGYLLLPTLSVLSGGADADWWLLPWFLCVLLSLRLVLALLRRRLRVSPELSTVWLERRVMAKRYDSYQWRKLLWFGLGLGTYLALHRPYTFPAFALALGCIGGGMAGEVWFRRRSSAEIGALRNRSDIGG